MADFNDIGIPRQLDWPRVRKLLTIGVFGACGFHVPTCALVFLGKQGLPEETLARFALYFPSLPRPSSGSSSCCWR